MKRYAQLTREAEGDLAEAFDYYEAQLSGLGEEFVAAVERQLEQVVENPVQYQALHRDVRRAVIRRFPYAIFYSVEGDAVIVLAIEHQARDPAHWQRRL